MESYIKTTIPTREALHKKLSQQWGGVLTKVNQELGGVRYELLCARKKLVAWVIASLALLGIFSYAVAHSATLPVLILVFAVMLAIGVYVVIIIHHFSKQYKKYSFALNKILLEEIFSVFKIDVAHQSGDDPFVKSHVSGVLKRSELLTERVDNLTIDDTVEGFFDDHPLALSEIRATRTEGSGKNRRTVTVFNGVFGVYELPAAFEGITFVSTEGDKSGFGHQSFWGSVTGSNAIKPTELEWNEFEKDLHVATNDPTEARYILTPDFMSDLHKWWKGNERNIRMTFRDSHIYMLFPSTKTAIGSSTLSKKSDALLKYSYNMAEPLWYMLMLLEDSRVRFR